jgi:alpha 1,2-mannosyltransferase
MATIFVLMLALIYRSLVIPKNGYCNSSTDCYNLLKEKAAERFYATPPSLDQQRNELQEQNQAFDAMYKDTKEQQQKKAMGVDMNRVAKVAAEPTEKDKSDEIVLSEHLQTSKGEQEYKRLTDASLPRIKAAYVVLVRNSELYALRSSMRHLEDRLNHKFNYPWIFLNEEPFTEEFKNLTRMMTKSEVHYGLVPKEHWSYPDWIDQERAAKCRKDMADQNIVYGGSESYRHMCRYQSGFFMLHPLLDDLDYYW